MYKIGFISLGCPKATVDSERILTQLRAAGYSLGANYTDADLVIINTCGFIEPAVAEALDVINEALSKNPRVLVTGCLGTRAAWIKQQFPQVLAVTGPQEFAELMALVRLHLPLENQNFSACASSQHEVRLTPRHYAYLKIAEGCDHRCSFCVIPQLRGKLRSRPIGEILNEAERLLESGVRELLIIAQDTSAYGQDLRYRSDFWRARVLKTRLFELARALSEFPAWIRLHYLYPAKIIDDLIPLMAAGQILPYLDLPLQHVNSRILKSMRRPAASEKFLHRLANWRAICPELTVRSTFIIGFPGETEADFAELLEFLQLAQLDRVGCFPYSQITGAAANDLPHQVPEELKHERVERFMSTQADISRAKLKARIGQQVIVLIDKVLKKKVYARTAGDAPEIDGKVIISGAWEMQPGDFIKVIITGADEHDLWAQPI